MGNWGLVDAASGVDVDGVSNFVRWLSALIRMLRLILAGRREQKAAIWGKSQTPEERGQRLVRVQAGVFEPKTGARRVGFRGGLHWHHGRQGHRGRR